MAYNNQSLFRVFLLKKLYSCVDKKNNNKKPNKNNEPQKQEVWFIFYLGIEDVGKEVAQVITASVCIYTSLTFPSIF